ncbi:MAG: prolipoprotein diacylglyceryl transferase [Desulfobulbaceae bacterium]|nr:MAG: prolipoprotein diacylglyceryl transferase [Desulfobulbaceae bacterium]
MQTPFVHALDPVFLSLGPLQIRWYGLMYVIGFSASYFLARHQIRRWQFSELEQHFENLNLVLILSVILGGRLGYVLFYNPAYYFRHPLEILATWEGGMSFHGACLLLIVSGWLFCRKHGIDFWKGADIYVATIPVGLGLGRIGNFINGELFGRQTDVPWGVIFPDGGAVVRHPSQLYEALLEGAVLFLLLWTVKARPWQGRPLWPHGSILALFLIGYGIFRMFVEQFREPDPQIGFLFGLVTMGQSLSLAMVIGGIVFWLVRMRQQKTTPAATPRAGRKRK